MFAFNCFISCHLAHAIDIIDQILLWSAHFMNTLQNVDSYVYIVYIYNYIYYVYI